MRLPHAVSLAVLHHELTYELVIKGCLSID
jgi:hypothetical protein